MDHKELTPIALLQFMLARYHLLPALRLNKQVDREAQ